MVNDDGSHGLARHFEVSLLAGGLAGFSVDISLYPIDTIKTRLQSQQGFLKSGGFRSIYKGLPSVAVGSIPGAALFFCTYEAVKAACHNTSWPIWKPVIHMGAACSAEVVACVVRVPVEVVKQRTQAYQYRSAAQAFLGTLKSEGIPGLYRGYWSTIWREIPFSFIQFPLWEFLKSYWSRQQGHEVHAWQSSTCGAIAGGIAAGLTTPLDVAKTRIMLAKTNSSMAEGSIRHAVVSIYMESGLSGLFAGVLPRTVWIALGGAIFLGVYDKGHAVLRQQRLL